MPGPGSLLLHAEAQLVDGIARLGTEPESRPGPSRIAGEVDDPEADGVLAPKPPVDGPAAEGDGAAPAERPQPRVVHHPRPPREGCEPPLRVGVDRERPAPVRHRVEDGVVVA